MDPAEVLNVRFHYGGQFIRIGPNLNYVGGDTAMSEIERDKISLPEVKGFLADHMAVKDSMKFYFHIPGKNLVDGLQFIYSDQCCLKMSDYVTDGGVADIYVEYNGEEDSGSDFEDEVQEIFSGNEEEPDAVITAEEESCGVITGLISSPLKSQFAKDTPSQSSQVTNPSQPVVARDLVGIRDTTEVLAKRMEIPQRKLNHILEKEGETKEQQSKLKQMQQRGGQELLLQQALNPQELVLQVALNLQELLPQQALKLEHRPLKVLHQGSYLLG